MAVFQMVPLSEAVRERAASKRDQIQQEYAGYLAQLGDGLAGKLEPLANESMTMIARRLRAAARAAGKEVTIRRSRDALYVWLKDAPVVRKSARSRAPRSSNRVSKAAPKAAAQSVATDDGTNTQPRYINHVPRPPSPVRSWWPFRRV
jgi:hypothetical protein